MTKFKFKDFYEKEFPYLQNKFYNQLKKEVFEDSKHSRYECNMCNEKIPLFLPSKSFDKFWCPKCGSINRQRLIVYYLKNFTNIFSQSTKFLHFAPEPHFFELFENFETIDYLPVDLNPNHPLIKEVVDMCQIPYPDNTFEVIFNSHVLEHIPDDIKAMEELYRCVKPASENGLVIIMVPQDRNLECTFENEEYNTPKLRLKHFNQEDHVRIYGLDIKNRLESVGFHVTEIMCSELIDEKLIEYYGFYEKEVIFICKKY